MQKKNMSFGTRGWLLLIASFLGFILFQVFTNYPMNILANFYGGAKKISTIYTAMNIVGIVTQLILSSFVGKIRSIKKLTIVFGVLALIAAFGVVYIPAANLSLWYVAYAATCFTSTMYALFGLKIIIGQWFPRRKGTVVGLATTAFPVANGLIGLFSSTAMAPLATGGTPNVHGAFLPFLVAVVIGFIIFLFFVTDYPEQCGCFRDNDCSFTAEVAQQMLAEEIENKKSTVWTTGRILSNLDFWLITIPTGLLLMGAVGTMTQSKAIISTFESLNYTSVMMIIAVSGIIGSWLLGVLDTKFGTRKAMTISTLFMVAAGIFGIIAVTQQIAALLVVSLVLLAVFMGASSNFTVSLAVQYWRREDFSGLFACDNAIANIFQAFAPTVIVALVSKGGTSLVFGFLLAAGVIGTVLMLIFSPKRVKMADDKLRKNAGKPLDDALEGRK